MCAVCDGVRQARARLGRQQPARQTHAGSQRAVAASRWPPSSQLSDAGAGVRPSIIIALAKPYSFRRRINRRVMISPPSSPSLSLLVDLPCPSRTLPTSSVPSGWRAQRWRSGTAARPPSRSCATPRRAGPRRTCSQINITLHTVHYDYTWSATYPRPYQTYIKLNCTTLQCIVVTRGPAVGR